MSKLAATLASLLLIASSVGVNIARYPQVGRTVDAEQRSDATGAANSAPLAPQSSFAEKANPDSLSASEAQVEPAKPPKVDASAPVENAGAEPLCGSKQAAGTALSGIGSAATILDVRPMVPVATLRAVGSLADPPVGYDEVRRLPPVEPSVSAVADPQTAGSDVAESYTATATP
ncbi:MAG: hypothetical protein ACLP9L_29980 [Thermoguttaceae bacterium]